MEINQHHRAGGVDSDSLLNALPGAVRDVTNQPDAFWTRQRAAIRSRIAVEQASHQPAKGLVLATALALILVVTTVLKTSAPPPMLQAQTDPDQELLLAVEQAVYSDVPEALAPATILAEEMTQQPRSTSKETQNAN